MTHHFKVILARAGDATNSAEEVVAAARKLLGRGPKTVLVKRGSVLCVPYGQDKYTIYK